MKSVVITGSTRGIGYCMAKEFLRRGCSVTVSGRSAEFPEAAREGLGEFSDSLFYVKCNVKEKAEVENLWNEAVKRWGRVDIWINNAGQNTPYEYAFDTEKGYVDSVLDTNIKGMIYGSQVAARNMLAQGGGQIWNMEGLGSNNMLQAKTILYGTTKHALTYFTRGLAKELDGKGVLVGRLSPGMMLTDFIVKTPDGVESPVIADKSFIKIFNILADRPETVARFFVPKMLENRRNNAHIVWLTSAKASFRFITSAFTKRKLI